MKKVSLFAALALILLTSISAVDKKTSTNQQQKSKARVSWHIKETYVEPLTFTNCDFDLLNVPDFTVTIDLHGVSNGKITLVQGSMTFSGTGTSQSTGEVFKMYFKDKLINKYPVIKGATVLIHKRLYDFTGNQGSVTNIINNTRLTINANGEIVSDDERTEIVCI